MAEAAKRRRPFALSGLAVNHRACRVLVSALSTLAFACGAAAQTEKRPDQERPATQPAAPATDAQEKDDEGCGDRSTKLDMEPPPLDQPQPRWECEQTELEIEPVWYGKPAEFVFKVRNVGEGVLNIKIRKP